MFTVATHYLIHHKQDTVGVAVAEGIEAAHELSGWLMDGDATVTIRARDPIPLGHKIALARDRRRRFHHQVRPRHRAGDRADRQGTSRARA